MTSLGVAWNGSCGNIKPMRPSSGADTTRGQLGRLLQADDGTGHLLPVTVRSHDGQVNGALYEHAKVGIVDDQWLSIGSANLNEHSLINGTELTSPPWTLPWPEAPACGCGPNKSDGHPDETAVQILPGWLISGPFVQEDCSASTI